MRPFLFILFGFTVLAFAGCAETQKPDDAMMPGAAPAAWEGGMPGMSGMGTR